MISSVARTEPPPAFENVNGATLSRSFSSTMSASTPRTSLRRKTAISQQTGVVPILTPPTEGLRHAPKINQPFIPDTAPARRSHTHHGLTSPQPPTSPHHVNMNPAANPQSAQFAVDSWEGKDNRQVPMSTREVPTPGNRPLMFSHVRDPSKMPRQLDYQDPYFPLRYLEVPRSQYPHASHESARNTDGLVSLSGSHIQTCPLWPAVRYSRRSRLCAVPSGTNFKSAVG